MSGWVRLHRSFRDNGHLKAMPDAALRIWLILLLAVDRRTGEVQLTYNDLREETGYGRSTISAALDWLENPPGTDPYIARTQAKGMPMKIKVLKWHLYQSSPGTTTSPETGLPSPEPGLPSPEPGLPPADQSRTGTTPVPSEDYPSPEPGLPSPESGLPSPEPGLPPGDQSRTGTTTSPKLGLPQSKTRTTYQAQSGSGSGFAGTHKKIEEEYDPRTTRRRGEGPDASASVTDENAVHWRDYFRQRFFGLEPRWDKAEVLDNAAEAGVSHAVIIREIQRAIDARKRDPVSWAASVIGRMAAAGVRTLADADRYEQEQREEEARRAQAKRQAKQEAEPKPRPRRPPLLEVPDDFPGGYQEA